MKTFGDLKPGDNVFWVSSDWVFHTFKVLDVNIKYGSNVKLTLDNNIWSGYYPKNQVSSGNSLWSDKEKALSHALEKAKRVRDYYINKIDEMISKYDEIEKFIKKYEGC
jgi:hypothetical protein